MNVYTENNARLRHLVQIFEDGSQRDGFLLRPLSGRGLRSDNPINPTSRWTMRTETMASLPQAVGSTLILIRFLLK